MRDALSTLPWVEQATIQADAAKKEVRFGVKKVEDFDLKAAQDAIAKQGFNDVTVVSSPKKP